jgi:hypothetical protein
MRKIKLTAMEGSPAVFYAVGFGFRFARPAPPKKSHFYARTPTLTEKHIRTPRKSLFQRSFYSADQAHPIHWLVLEKKHKNKNTVL